MNNPVYEMHTVSVEGNHPAPQQFLQPPGHSKIMESTESSPLYSSRSVERIDDGTLKHGQVASNQSLLSVLGIDSRARSADPRDVPKENTERKIEHSQSLLDFGGQQDAGVAVTFDPYTNYKESVCFPGPNTNGVANGKSEVGKSKVGMVSDFDDMNYEPIQAPSMFDNPNYEPAQAPVTFDDPNYGDIVH